MGPLRECMDIQKEFHILLSLLSEITRRHCRMQHLQRMFAKRCCLRQTALLYFYSILEDHTPYFFLTQHLCSLSLSPLSLFLYSVSLSASVSISVSVSSSVTVSIFHDILDAISFSFSLLFVFFFVFSFSFSSCLFVYEFQ